MESILLSIKKLLGISNEYEVFDADLIMHINTALMVLTQIGVGPSTGFYIVDSSETWTDFLGEDLHRLGAVKSYVYMKVKLLFDPPSSSSVIESTNKIIDEMEWRLHVATDPIEGTSEVNNQNGE